jgi:hypothetical protein
MWRNVKTAGLLVSVIGLLLLVSGGSSVRAQESAEETVGMARLFDEFGPVGGCDQGARLDNFAIELMTNKSVTGHIICYGPEGEGSGTGEYRRRITEDYLVNTRGIDPARFKAVYGGRYKSMGESFTALWIVPDGAEPPQPESYPNEGKSFSGLFAEFNSSSAVQGLYEDAGTGPGVGNLTYAGFTDVLRQQPGAVAYVVAINSSSAPPGAWRRTAKEIAGTLESGYGIRAERIKIIYGGYQKLEDEFAGARIQLWVAPANAPPPVAEVKEPEPMPDKAVQIDALNEYALDSEDNLRQIFEQFADILKMDERMRVCIIIRTALETEGTEAEEETEKAPDTEDAEAASPETDAPKIDMFAIVETWKSELEKKYGISRNRLVIMTASARDQYLPGALETWAVPPGAQLPDPNAVEEEQPVPEGESVEANVSPR